MADTKGVDVRIAMSSHGRGEVFLNGEKVPGVVGVDFAASVGKTNVVTLRVRADCVEITGIADVTTIASADREFRGA